ncbi:MAG: glycoside hydrolase family 31 protein [Anaerolineae bacterium]|nr:glycoside hydrolase family 31 protein [Anaerolineae bacterium]
MNPFHYADGKLTWRSHHEQVTIQAWGRDTLRVRATQSAQIVEMPGALLEPEPVEPAVEMTDELATITNGKLCAEITAPGRIRFTNAGTGELLLEEEAARFHRPLARHYRSRGGDSFRIVVRFSPKDDERFYGLGQQPHGRLDQKGCVIDLEHHNTEVSIPFLVSSRHYGFLWHNPAIGRVDLAHNGTRWVAESARQIDYLVMAGDTYADIMARYADATGYPLMLPEWASGFWQSKFRYLTQDELLGVAREYQARELPLSVIVSDLHIDTMGDMGFPAARWPDPAALVRELGEMGVRCMVSIWPAVDLQHPEYRSMMARGLLLRSERGLPALFRLPDFANRQDKLDVYMNFYDPTNPEARQFLWERVRDAYYKLGIKVWRLDACEPEIVPQDYDHIRYCAGGGMEVNGLYPLMHQQGFYEGMRAEGETEIVLLCRSAWAGSQRYGAAVWSGDITSTFETLQGQVRAGLNVGMSGIPWWTTDIGGFQDGDINDPHFHELIVRWFQYGVFCPLFRLHGARRPGYTDEATGLPTGAANEVWSFGDEAYEVIKEYLFLRERLRPYVMEQMKTAHETGVPPMRPLFFEFEEDPHTVPVEDQFMLGSDILVAPVLSEGVRLREVYLPLGTNWVDAWTGQEFEGGHWLYADAPLEKIPVYLRTGSALYALFAGE